MDSRDAKFMAQAIGAGREARFWAEPNPAVGCVLVRDDQVLGSGFTQPAGQHHAEVHALSQLADAKGATAYVTLEPCCHQGKTGPCTEALIAAGVRRVVVALEDPNPLVSGTGIARLRSAGIEVSVGELADRVERELAGFLLRMRRGWGRVTVKIASSLDGRTAMASGESQWITGAPARRDVQLLRAESGAIVTGIGTVLADDCHLTLRAQDLPLEEPARSRAFDHPPLRVVMDSQGRIPLGANVLKGAASVVFSRVDLALPEPAINVRLGADQSGRLDIAQCLQWLGEREVNEILVEAGPTLTGALIAGGWVDRIVVYQAPRILGSDAHPMAELAVQTLDETPAFRIDQVTQVGDDIRITAIRAGDAPAPGNA